MFNDRYGLTNSVIERYKKQTRRIEKSLAGIEDAIDNLGFTRFEYKPNGVCWLWDDKTNTFLEYVPRYKVGEVVAVAQSYETINETFFDSGNPLRFYHKQQSEALAGWKNKMFVKAELMPHQIRITNVRIERLQDISEEDCIKEGVLLNTRQYEYDGTKRYCVDGIKYWRGIGLTQFDTAREAYAVLIDKVSGKETWDSNPYVFVYDFELIK